MAYAALYFFAVAVLLAGLVFLVSEAPSFSRASLRVALRFRMACARGFCAMVLGLGREGRARGPERLIQIRKTCPRSIEMLRGIIPSGLLNFNMKDAFPVGYGSRRKPR